MKAEVPGFRPAFNEEAVLLRWRTFEQGREGSVSNVALPSVMT